MTSGFTIKYKKTQGGPPNAEVEFELVDTTSGVQGRVDWRSALGFGIFMYRTNSSPGTSDLGGSMATSTSREHDDPPQPSKTAASKR